MKEMESRSLLKRKAVMEGRPMPTFTVNTTVEEDHRAGFHEHEPHPECERCQKS